MKYFTICLFLVYTVSINSQLVSKKEFRLKNSGKSFLYIKSFEINDKLDVRQTQLSLKISSQKVTVSSNGRTSYKSPWLFFGLSFIVPGAALGQLYNEQYLNFGIRLGISAITMAILLLENRPCGECNGYGASFTPLLIFVANWITSFIEAPISSASINKKNGRK